MPRRRRCADGGYVYHVLNRAVGRATLFEKSPDLAAFEKVLTEAQDVVPVPLLAYGLMPTHWHLLLWPQEDGQLSEHLRWLTVTHTQRWHAQHHTAGTGPRYQGRFKSFPVAADDHLLRVWRYVERNALRAGLVRGAENWRWCSLWQRVKGPPTVKLAEGPVPRPADWTVYVNLVETEGELAALRRSLVRGCPFGEEAWVRATAARMGLESRLRPRGRPRKSQTQ